MPSVINPVLFYALMVLIPVAFFGPALWQWRQRFGWHGQAAIGRGEDCELSPDLKLWHRMLCVLLSYVFLVGPEAFQYFAQAAIQYSNLSTLAWGKGNTIITYGYDDNGSLTSKTTREGSNTVEAVVCEYNLQNRLAKVTTTPYVNNVAQTPEIVEYAYNPDGIRTQKLIDSTLQTDYLIDPANHTGYSQVLEEWATDNANPAAPVLLSTVYYTIGDDIIAQTRAGDVNGTWTVYGTEYLLYDGHGSTRQLARPDKSVIDSYSYDGYGVMLSSGSGAEAASNAATSLLYTGEQYDPDVSGYYLRARYYNPANGLFNRMDSYSGNTSDPQSLHKYTYCHNNPINNIDPSGMLTFTLGEVLYISACISILAGMLTYNYTASLGAAVLVGAAAFVATFILLGGVGLTMAAIAGGSGATTSPQLLNPDTWQQAEQMLGEVLRKAANMPHLAKNTITYFEQGMQTGRVPDFVARGQFIADAKWYQVPLNVSQQLRDFVMLAQTWEIPLYIFVRSSTHVSQPALDLIESTGGGVIVIFE